MRAVRKSLYVATGFALGMIIGYLLFLVIPVQSVTAIESKAWIILIVAIIGAYYGYKLFQSGYKLKIWQQILISFILLGALYYGIWFLHQMYELGKVLKNFN